jgi:hypothetical protein
MPWKECHWLCLQRHVVIEHLAVASRNVRLEEPPALFGAQGNHRVDSRGAARGDEAGHQ